MEKIGIVLLNYNSTQETIECLKSLDTMHTDKYAVVIAVVDNNSSPEEVEKLNDFFREYIFKNPNIQINFVENAKNFGFSGGCNIGIRYVLDENCDYVLILNNDTIVDKNFLIELIEALKENPKYAIAVPKIYFAPGYEFHKDRYKKDELGKVFWYTGGIMDWKNMIGHHRGVDEVDHGQYDVREKVEYATGACLLVRSDVLKKVGLFDEKYFLYYEDSDLSMRVKRKGFSILYVPTAVVWHKNAGSTGGSGSKLQDYFISRNRVLFGMKFAPLRAKLALIKESLRLLKTGREWQKKGIADFYLGRFGKGRYPVR